MRYAGSNLAGNASTTVFVDQSHFTSAFRREVGVTPGRLPFGSGRVGQNSNSVITNRKSLQGTACARHYAIQYGGRATDMTGDDEALQAKTWRDSATELLQRAAQTSNPALRDALTRKALVQIEEARRLLDTVEAPLPQPATRLH